MAKSLARTILDAYDAAAMLDPPSVRDPGFDMAAAYDVLVHVARMRAERGERPLGRKIGFTNRSIWDQYGVDSPIWAPVYDSTVRTGAAVAAAGISLARMVAPRIEPEIAFGLRRAVSAGSREPERILESIEWVAPAFELVDCPYRDWKFRLQDTVAAQGLHAALLLGPVRRLDRHDAAQWAHQLAACRATLACGERVEARGIGANALGHPALALGFLADVLAQQPHFAPLAAGEIVTTGTLTDALPIASGESWTFTLEGIELAPLSVRFS